MLKKSGCASVYEWANFPNVHIRKTVAHPDIQWRLIKMTGIGFTGADKVKNYRQILLICLKLYEMKKKIWNLYQMDD